MRYEPAESADGHKPGPADDITPLALRRGGPLMEGDPESYIGSDRHVVAVRVRWHLSVVSLTVASAAET